MISLLIYILALHVTKQTWFFTRSALLTIQSINCYVCLFVVCHLLRDTNTGGLLVKDNRSSHLGIHKQTNACWSIPRSQTVFYHFKIGKKWELSSLVKQFGQRVYCLKCKNKKEKNLVWDFSYLGFRISFVLILVFFVVWINNEYFIVGELASAGSVDVGIWMTHNRFDLFVWWGRGGGGNFSDLFFFYLCYYLHTLRDSMYTVWRIFNCPF